MKTGTFVTGIIGLIVGVAVGYWVFGGSTTSLGASAPSGTTYNTSKVAEMNLQVATDTVYTILNTDATDRIITSFSMYGTGGTATTSQYSVNCATSSTASGVGASTSYILSQNLSQTGFGTTTGSANPLYIASSSPGLTGTSTATSLSTGLTGANAIDRVWPTQTYLTCKLVDNTSGANALNTLDANTVGYIDFGYRAQ